MFAAYLLLSWHQIQRSRFLCLVGICMHHVLTPAHLHATACVSYCRVTQGLCWYMSVDMAV